MSIVDVREDNELARGHIPGTAHLGKSVVDRNIEKTIPNRETPIILHFSGGFRSGLTADYQQRKNYCNVISMDGGWRGWTESGFPII